MWYILFLKKIYIIWNTGISELKINIFSFKLWLMELININSGMQTFLWFKKKIQFFLFYMFFLPTLKIDDEAL